jgi:hypothetical protein
MNPDLPSPDDCHEDDRLVESDRPTSPPDAADEREGESAEAESPEVSFELDIQNRLWLRAILPVLQLRPRGPDPGGRVQFAFDRMLIAACERAARILGSDLPATEP